MAGATTLHERDAVAGIEVHSGDIRARKSYFFLHDENIIFTLGSHISGRGQTESIVHTFPLGASQPELLVNGAKMTVTEGEPIPVPTPCWIHGPAGGYYFPEIGSVTVSSETRQPDFSDARDSSPEKQAQVSAQRFVSIFFDHGENPANAAYACAYFPAATAAEMPQLAENVASHAVYVCTSAGHSLEHGSFTAVAFFRPGTLGYRANRACFLALRQSDAGIRLSLYEPSWVDCTLKIGFPFAVAAKTLPGNCRLAGNVLDVDVTAGCPVECDLQRLSP